MLSKFGRRNISKIIYVFGCSLKKFKSGRQTHKLAAHYKRNNRDFFMSTHADSLVSKQKVNGQTVKEIANMSTRDVIVVESLEVREHSLFLFYHDNLNKLLLLQCKHSRLRYVSMSVCLYVYIYVCIYVCL